MQYEWNYPIAVLAHGGGYASLVDEQSDPPQHSLIVLTDLSKVTDVMQQIGILGAPKMIQNAREFRWLLESLRAPVSNVAFDINPVEADANAAHTQTVELLLRELVADFSPWNYPIFLVAIEDGFASISGQNQSQQDLQAIAVFRSNTKATTYVEATGGGELCEIKNLKEAVKFFQAIAESVNAVALDPVLEEGRFETQHCFDIQTLLTKYLIADTNEEG